MAEVSQAFLVRLCPHPQLVMGVFPFAANLNSGWWNCFPKDRQFVLQLTSLRLFWAAFSCSWSSSHHSPVLSSQSTFPAEGLRRGSGWWKRVLIILCFGNFCSLPFLCPPK